MGHSSLIIISQIYLVGLLFYLILFNILCEMLGNLGFVWQNYACAAACTSEFPAFFITILNQSDMLFKSAHWMVVEKTNLDVRPSWILLWNRGFILIVLIKYYRFGLLITLPIIWYEQCGFVFAPKLVLYISQVFRDVLFWLDFSIVKYESSLKVSLSHVANQLMDHPSI